MAITPDEWLQVAERSLCEEEPLNRTAAGRGYYAAFHECRALSESLPDPPTSTRGMHERAIQAMIQCPVSGKNRERVNSIKKIGIKLNQAKDIRTKADYNTAAAFTRAEAEEAIGFAKEVIRMFRSLPP